MSKQEMVGRPIKKDERDEIVQEKQEMWLQRVKLAKHRMIVRAWRNEFHFDQPIKGKLDSSNPPKPELLKRGSFE